MAESWRDERREEPGSGKGGREGVGARGRERRRAILREI